MKEISELLKIANQLVSSSWYLELRKKYNLKYEPSIFKNKDNAISFAAKGSKNWVMTKDGIYFVMAPVDCAKLEHVGFEYVS